MCDIIDESIYHALITEQFWLRIEDVPSTHQRHNQDNRTGSPLRDRSLRYNRGMNGIQNSNSTR